MRSAQPGGQFGFVPLHAETAHGAVPTLRALVPFGRIADDARLSAGPCLEAHFGHRQDARPVACLQQRDVELPAIDKFLREPVTAQGCGACGGAGQGGVPSGHHAAVVQPQRGVFQRRFDDPPPLVQPCPGGRDAPVGRGQARATQQLLGAGLVIGEVHRPGTDAGEAHAAVGQHGRSPRRQPAQPVHAFHQIEYELGCVGRQDAVQRFGTKGGPRRHMAALPKRLDNGGSGDEGVLFFRRRIRRDVGMQHQHPHQRPFRSGWRSRNDARIRPIRSLYESPSYSAIRQKSE